MNRARAKNLRVLALAATLVAIMSGLVAYAPTLYRIFCAVTGYGGRVQRATVKPLRAAGVDEAVVVRFDANVAPNLDWEFRPEQGSVKTQVGEPTKVYYYAKNNSNETVVARATYNVAPFQVAPYFFKIECFCFTEEKLRPGESARMPLVFYVDEQFLKDVNTRNFRHITLSYTFFKQDIPPQEVEAVRDLRSGSQSLDARLKASPTAEFDNDAPRRR